MTTHGFSYVGTKRSVAGLCKGQPILEETNQYGLVLLEQRCFLILRMWQRGVGCGSEVLADRGSSRTFLNTQIEMIYDRSCHGLSEAAELRRFRGKHLL